MKFEKIIWLSQKILEQFFIKIPVSNRHSPINSSSKICPSRI